MSGRAAVLGIALWATAAAHAQSVAPRALGRGELLIASQKLVDPNFAESVVLLLEYGEDGALGVILNRPSSIDLATAFPENEELAESSDLVYFGGPVAPTGVLFLVRAEDGGDELHPVLDGLFWSGSQELLVAAAAGEQELRVFAGHAGWAPRQLDTEVERGDWRILPADLETVFDESPGGLWQRLIEQTTTRFASVALCDRQTPIRR